MSRLAWVATSAAAVALTATTAADAVTITWTGDGDGTSYTDSANWSGGNVPASNDYQDVAKFTGATDPAERAITLGAGRSVNGLIFDNTAGWSITGAQLHLKTIQSSGSGINTLQSVKIQQSSQTWTIGAGNTLVIESLIHDGTSRDLRLVGGGLLSVGGRIGYSWSSNHELVLDGASARIASDRVYLHTSGSARISDESSTLQLLTTVAGAESLIIAGRIVHDLGDGYSLSVADIGGGYVEIGAVIPEPASLVLLAISGLAMLPRRI